MDFQYSDAIVLLPVDEEWDALSKAFHQAGWDVTDEDHSSCGFQVRIAVRDGLTESNKVRSCRIVRLPHQNILNAARATAKCFQTHDTSIVVSFGIAGKIHEDVEIGDVVIAEQVIYYDPAKEKPLTTESRSYTYNVAHVTADFFKKFQNRTYSVKPGLVASGSRLMADPLSDTRERLKKINTKIFCVEMEAAGVVAVCEELRPSYKVYAVKGMSDSADPDKGGKDDALNRVRAAEHAAEVLVSLLESTTIHVHERYLLSESSFDKHFKAKTDLDRLIEGLKHIKVKTDPIDLYRCVFGLPAPIPMYFHWKQQGPYLHWVDFKLLMMLNQLPKDLVQLIPNVTHDGVAIGTKWIQTVEDLVGMKPFRVDNLQLRDDPYKSELFRQLTLANIYSRADEQDSKVDRFIQQEILTHALASSNQNRLIVCSWRQHIKRWMGLIPILGYKYASFTWPTMNLGGKEGKWKGPGQSLYMDAPHFDGVKEWCAEYPDLVGELAEHFSFVSPLLSRNSTATDLIDVLRVEVGSRQPAYVRP